MLEMEARLQSQTATCELLQRQNDASCATLQNYQNLLEAYEDAGEVNVITLKAELTEKKGEAATLQEELEECHRRIEDLLQEQQNSMRAAEQVVSLQDALRSSEEEKGKLSGDLNRYLQKMEKYGEERAHMVDKRLVVHMVGTFMAKRDELTHHEEILARMADVLGFTLEERSEVGFVVKSDDMVGPQDL